MRGPCQEKFGEKGNFQLCEGQALSHVFRFARRSNYKFLGAKLVDKNFFWPNTQDHIVPPDLPSQEAYRLGCRLARQVQWNKLKLCIWPKKIFIDSFNAKIMQLSRQGCSNFLNFFWKDLLDILSKCCMINISKTKMDVF